MASLPITKLDRRSIELGDHTHLIGAYLYPKSFLESEGGRSVEGPQAHDYLFNPSVDLASEWGDDPPKNFIDEVKANFERYYGIFITRSLMDLATIVAPMCRLLAGDIWKVAFNDELGAAINRGKRLVIFNPKAFASGEDDDGTGHDSHVAPTDLQSAAGGATEIAADVEDLVARAPDSDGDAIVDSGSFSLIWTLAACGFYRIDQNFGPVPKGAESLIRTWRRSLVGESGACTLEDVMAIYYAWRHDQALWAPAMQRIGQFPYREKMPFLCDAPTREIGYYPAFAQLAYPAHPNVREAKRFRYVAEGKVTPMFMDVIVFDECRYVHDWISALHLTPEDWDDLSTQLTFRFALDGIANDKRWMGDDFLYGCHAVGECEEFPMGDLEPRVDLSPPA